MESHNCSHQRLDCCSKWGKVLTHLLIFVKLYFCLLKVTALDFVKFCFNYSILFVFWLWCSINLFDILKILFLINWKIFSAPFDHVKCFSCGIRLNKWLPENDPWEEHKKYSPNCPFLLERYKYYLGNDVRTIFFFFT